MKKLKCQENKYTCINSECKQVFDTPKIVHYYVCPFCSSILENVKIERCLNYFGYLYERETGEDIPGECTECRKVIECMLGSQNSKDALEEIKKWYI